MRLLLGVAIGVTVATVAGYFLGVKPDEVAKNVAGAAPWSIALCVVSCFVMFGVQSLRWHLVMGPLLGLRYGQAYRAQVVGYMFNAIIPARGGDLLRVEYLGRRTGKSRATILATEIVDRWLDFWGWIPVIVVISLATDLPKPLLGGLLGFAGLLLVWAGAMILLGKSGYSPKKESRFYAFYQSFRAGIEAFRARRTWFIAFAVAPLPWLWESFVISQASRGFGIHLSMAQAFLVLVGFNFATVIPTPGGVGAVEAGGTATLAMFGVDRDKALAFMFVYHLCQLLPGIIAGAAILVAEGEQLFGRAPAATVETVASETAEPDR